MIGMERSAPIESSPAIEPAIARVRTRLVWNVGWTALATGMCQAGTLASSVLFARFLGPDGYGRLGMVQSALLTMSMIAGLGLGNTATKYVAELRSRDGARAGRILGLCGLLTLASGGILGAIQWVLAPTIAADLLDAADLCRPLRITALAVLFLTLNGYQVAVLSGLEAFARLAWLGAIQGPLLVISAAALAWPLGLEGAAWAVTLAAASSWALYRFQFQRECRRYGIRATCRGIGGETRMLWTFALPSALSGCVTALACVAAHAALVRQGDGFVEMAMFNAANTVRLLLMLPSILVSRVARPLLCNLRVASSPAHYQGVFWKYVALNGGVALVLAVAMLPFASLLLSVFGNGFEGGGRVLGFLLVGGVIEATATSLYQSEYGRGRMWFQLGVSLAWSAALLGGIPVIERGGGATALAIAYAAAWTTSAVLYLALTRSIFRAEPKGAAAHPCLQGAS